MMVYDAFGGLQKILECGGGKKSVWQDGQGPIH
jgi:hypothetical protein